MLWGGYTIAILKKRFSVFIFVSRPARCAHNDEIDAPDRRETAQAIIELKRATRRACDVPVYIYTCIYARVVKLPLCTVRVYTLHLLGGPIRSPVSVTAFPFVVSRSLLPRVSCILVPCTLFLALSRSLTRCSRAKLRDHSAAPREEATSVTDIGQPKSLYSLDNNFLCVFYADLNDTTMHKK